MIFKKDLKIFKIYVRGLVCFENFSVIMVLARGKKMANIINLKEIENRLYFDGTYTPIVCGNSNYYVQIQFSDEWNRCYFKTAVFVVGEKKRQMKFEGSLLRLPAFPNAPSFEMLVYAKDEDAIYSTTAIKIRLEPTPIGNLLDFQFED